MKILSSSLIAFALTVSLGLNSVLATESAEPLSHKQLLQKAQENIATDSKKVSKSHWFPTYHLASNVNLMGKPCALANFKGQYHLFYNQNPFSLKDENSHWANAISPDLVNWTEKPLALAPSESYDNQGILPGSAIIDEEILYLIYTGNSSKANNEKTEILSTQNIALTKDGVNFGKSANNPVIKTAPNYSYLTFSSKNFTDPFVWKQSDRYYALIGTTYEKTNDGAVILFKSKDLRNWVFINVTAIGRNGEMGTLWESPNFVHIQNEDILVISPKGLKPQGKRFLNKHESGWLIGKLDYDSGKFKQKSAFGVFDKGFDFYAPKVTKLSDGRAIIIGSLSMPESPTPESEEGWAGMMSVPREMKIVNGKVITSPVEEIKTIRSNKHSLKSQTITIEKDVQNQNINIRGEAYEIETEVDLTNAKSFTAKFRTSAAQETVLSYDKDAKILKLNRDKSGKALSGEREAKLELKDNLLKLRIFVDKSSIEIFANDGQVVMSSRIYPDKTSVGIKLSSEGETKLNSFDFYRLKNVSPQ